MRYWVPATVLALWAAAALFGGLLPIEPNRVDLPRVLDGPGLDAWLGHDELGRPLLDRLIRGARVSFLVALSVVTISLLVGSAVGTASHCRNDW